MGGSHSNPCGPQSAKYGCFDPLAKLSLTPGEEPQLYRIIVPKSSEKEIKRLQRRIKKLKRKNVSGKKDKIRNLKKKINTQRQKQFLYSVEPYNDGPVFR